MDRCPISHPSLCVRTNRVSKTMKTPALRRRFHCLHQRIEKPTCIHKSVHGADVWSVVFSHLNSHSQKEFFRFFFCKYGCFSPYAVFLEALHAHDNCDHKQDDCSCHPHAHADGLSVFLCFLLPLRLDVRIILSIRQRTTNGEGFQHTVQFPSIRNVVLVDSSEYFPLSIRLFPDDLDPHSCHAFILFHCFSSFRYCHRNHL